VPHQERDVFPALVQTGNLKRAREPALEFDPHLLGSVGRANQAKVRTPQWSVFFAQPLVLAVLIGHPQKHRLNLERHIANFVEKQR
jgi:hypothetical protein